MDRVDVAIPLIGNGVLLNIDFVPTRRRRDLVSLCILWNIMLGQAHGVGLRCIIIGLDIVQSGVLRDRLIKIGSHALELFLHSIHLIGHLSESVAHGAESVIEEEGACCCG